MDTLLVSNGEYTIKNRVTGDHVTVQIRTKTRGDGFFRDKRIFSILDGPDNTSDYTGFGHLEHDGTLRIWQKPVFKKNPATNQVFQRHELEKLVGFVLKHGKFGDCSSELANKIVGDYEIMKSSTCCFCNRLLTTPESVHAGYGPECADKRGLQWGTVQTDDQHEAELFESVS